MSSKAHRRKRARKDSSTVSSPPSFPTHPRTLIRIDSLSEGQVSLIETLPDDVLLAIFDFSWDEDHIAKKQVEAWQLLVQVCRRWRSVVFESTCRLNLRLVFTPGTPATDTLHVWPPLPLYIRCYGGYTTKSVDNIITVLGRSNRVRQIDLMYIPCSDLEKVSAAMQEPFPQLTHLELSSSDKMVPPLPNLFLGGSAPSLKFLWLNRIPFPALPKLLSSAAHLVQLYLINISHSGYFSPEKMLTALCTLTNLTALHLDFQSPRSRPDWRSRRPPTPTRAVLKALTNILFKGVTEYLEDIVSGIDTPQLKYLDITLFNQILFDAPQLIQFIGRTPPLKALETTRVAFADGATRISLSSQTSGSGELAVKIPCRELDWQVSDMEQICTSCLPPLSTLDLYIYMDKVGYWQDNIENMLWMELLHPFTIVENLYISKQVTPRIMPAIQELVGDRTIEVLPALQNIFLEGLQSSGPVQEGIKQFVAARQLTSHPIAVSAWL